MTTSVLTIDRPSDPKDTLDQDVGLFSRIKIWWLLLGFFLFSQENGLFSKQDATFYDFGSLAKNADNVAFLRSLNALLVIILLAIIFPKIRIACSTLFQQKAIAATLLLAIVSASWSQVPLDTLRRAFLLATTLIFASYFSSAFSPTAQMRLVLATGLIVAIASIGMVIIFPEYGISSNGEWKGVFGHKNRLALGMVFLFSPLPFTKLSNFKEKLWCAVQGTLAISLIILSQSKTSLILVPIIAVVGALSRLVYRLRKDQLPFLALAATAVLLLLISLLVTDLGTFTELLGKDATLSGRTKNWGILLTFAVSHLWFGYGYAGFWTGATGDSGTALAGIGGAMSGADNGYIDTLLQFGLTGLVLVFFMFSNALRNLFAILRRPVIPLVTFWYATIVVILLVGNISESILWKSNENSTLFLVIACCALQGLASVRETTLQKS